MPPKTPRALSYRTTGTCCQQQEKGRGEKRKQKKCKTRSIPWRITSPALSPFNLGYASMSRNR
ncbi:hypothetical protein CGRA01v4_01630 [Colletotrichum graminicola]|nr:hypothetical protein CGRA01v4_01630 [Colletotrichum graminicola]